MNNNLVEFSSIAQMIKEWQPSEPVYCLYPHILSATVKRFIDGFTGIVMYAVKSNPDPVIVKAIYDAGIRYFDTASINEIKLIRKLFGDEARCYFMAPVRLLGTANDAYSRLGVKHFVIDHKDELDKILAEVPSRDITIFVRMVTHNTDATFELSSKFGATKEETINLVNSIAAAGIVPGLSFHIGSLVMQPTAHAKAMRDCIEVINSSRTNIPYLDVGGGFPAAYPGLDPRSPDDFFSAINNVKDTITGSNNITLLSEPGRALVADGLSVVTQVILRKGNSLYLNDGIYGSFNEPYVSNGKVKYPVRVYRGHELLTDKLQSYQLFGPTCDSLDKLPVRFDLPGSIKTGDWIEFGMIGGYSMANRTHFNGFYPDKMIRIIQHESLPPA